MHTPQMVEGSIIPLGYEQVQGDLEVSVCVCGGSLHRTLRGGWHHWSALSNPPTGSGS